MLEPPHGSVGAFPYPEYQKTGKPSQNLQHEVTIALKQRNEKLMQRLVEEIYDPKDPKYRQFLSLKKIRQLTYSVVASTKVKAWLKSHDLYPHWQSASGSYLKVNASITCWEKVLRTEFFQWGNKDTVHAEKYHLERHISRHVHSLFNVVDPEVVLHQHSRRLSYSGSSVTPAFLSQLYKKSVYHGSSSHKQSVFSTSNEYFSTTDLGTFQNLHGLQQSRVTSIGDHSLTSPDMCSTTSEPSETSCWEGNLDVQYLSSTAQTTETVFHYVSGGNPFVTYLTSVSDMDQPALVHSISWGSTEQAVSSSVLHSFCYEAMLLATRGVTIVVSSGDNGAVGTGYSSTGQCSSSTCNQSSRSKYWSSASSWDGTGFFPSFPATCPYVTAVGGTMGPEVGLAEVACQSDVCSTSKSRGGIITTGGGFSSYFPQPSWQQDAISKYLRSGVKLPAAGYNPAGRGYPDVSALAVRFGVVVGGDTYSIYGTSASAPVIAGFITLINALRAQNDMSPIGWINRALYEAAALDGNSTSPVFNDIVLGDNRCCSGSKCSAAVCCDGFTAAAGWDPVTGLGSINFPQFASVFSVAAPDYPAPTWRERIPLADTELYVLVAVAAAVTFCLCSFIFVRASRRSRPSDSDSFPHHRQRLERTDLPPVEMVVASAPPLSPLICPFCNIEFQSTSEIAAHIDRYHPSKI